MERYVFDYRKLNGRIHEVCGSQKAFAEAIGISTVSLSRKMKNKAYFSQKEIEKSKEVLQLEPGAVAAYFFAR